MLSEHEDEMFRAEDAKVEELTISAEAGDVAVAQADKTIERLITDRDKLKLALEKIEAAKFYGHMDDEDMWQHMRTIARNALKS